MFAKLTRAALIVVAAAALPAAAETAVAPADRVARVGYRDFGQGRYAFVVPATNETATYALTGRPAPSPGAGRSAAGTTWAS